ncbi:hypothetical protein G9A89_005466 [Geosiphon pyriformis]|nr:hypothetical protein G9A89_005466 [Geosiphon pyriformis]
MAPEILIDICGFLPPEDLNRLGLTCKKLFDFLFSTSESTQLIWGHSRKSYSGFHLQLPTPEGMSELEYTKLVYGKKCQFCYAPDSKIDWNFKVRSCQFCLNQKIGTMIYIMAKHPVRMPESIWKTLPSCLNTKSNRVFWITEVIARHKEYITLDEEARKVWLSEKTVQHLKYVEDRAHREGLYERFIQNKREKDRIAKKKLAAAIDAKITEYCCQHPKYKFHQMKRLPGYFLAVLVANEFTENGWKILLKKLIKEYERGQFRG